MNLAENQTTATQINFFVNQFSVKPIAMYFQQSFEFLGNIPDTMSPAY